MTPLRMMLMLAMGVGLAGCADDSREVPEGIKRIEKAVCRDFSPAEPMQSSDNNNMDMRQQTGQDPNFKGSEGCQ